MGMTTKQILQGIKTWTEGLIVYDISAAHNNTKYADLTAALGTNGANVPEGIRRGGMSVKFIQSSDNKYVQYMYNNTSTAVADFTNVDNWEKINVEKEVSKLRTELNGISGYSETTQYDGTTTTRTVRVNCVISAGKTIKVKLSNYVGTSPNIVFGPNDSLSGLGVLTEVDAEVSVVLSQDISGITFYNSGSASSYTVEVIQSEFIPGQLTEIEEEIDDLQNNADAVNQFIEEQEPINEKILDISDRVITKEYDSGILTGNKTFVVDDITEYDRLEIQILGASQSNQIYMGYNGDIGNLGLFTDESIKEIVSPEPIVNFSTYGASSSYQIKVTRKRYEIGIIEDTTKHYADGVYGLNLFDYKNTNNLLDYGYLNTTNGKLIYSKGYRYNITYYIPIKPNVSYCIPFQYDNNYASVIFYDKEKNFIEKQTLPTANKFNLISCSNINAAFVRISFSTAHDFNEFFLIQSNTVFKETPDDITYKYESLGKPQIIMNHWMGKNIALYGDSITELNQDSNTLLLSKNGWARIIREALAFSNAFSRGIGSTAAMHSHLDASSPWKNIRINSIGEWVWADNPKYSPELYPYQFNDIGMSDWDRIIKSFPETIKNDIDVIIFMTGTNEWMSNAAEGNIEFHELSVLPENPNPTIDVAWFNSAYYNGGDFDVTTFKGAVASSIMKLQTWMPQAVIVCVTPLSGNSISQLDRQNDTIFRQNSLGFTMRNIAEFMISVANNMSIPVIDLNGKTGINPYNRKYYIRDAVHPYEIQDGDNITHNNGCVAIARVIIGGLQSILPKFDWIDWTE